MKTEVYLIGTHHFDPKGEERLKILLGMLKPDCVTVEYDAERDAMAARVLTEFKEQVDKFNEKELKVYNILHKITKYEVTASRNFCSKIPLFYVDMESTEDEARQFYQQGIDMIRDVCGKAGRNFPFASILSFAADFSYKIHSLSFKKHSESIMDKLDEFEKTEKIGKRDAHMAENIKALHDDGKYRRIVHVGGLAHVLYDNKQRTLFEKIKDINPIKIALIEADEWAQYHDAPIYTRRKA